MKIKTRLKIGEKDLFNKVFLSFEISSEDKFFVETICCNKPLASCNLDVVLATNLVRTIASYINNASNLK